MQVGSPFLRRVLALDAVASGATGLLLAAGAGPLAPLLGLPEPLMRPAGVFLIGYAAVIGVMSRRYELPKIAVNMVVALNALWAIESLAILALGWVQPTALGYAFVVFQAVVVGVFAELQFIAVRRTTRVA